jgi:hypothetical protein
MGKQFGKCGLCAVFVSYTLAFALLLTKKQGKISFMVVEKCPDIPVAAVQYTFTHKQQYSTHSHTNSSTAHIHTQTAVQYTFTHKQQYITQNNIMTQNTTYITILIIGLRMYYYIREQ